MTREQWERVKAVFNHAIELPVESRHAWVADAAAGDEEVQREVIALLRAHDSADGFLQSSALAELNAGAAAAPLPPAGDGDDLAPGVRIGDYEIKREIDRGGMGIVYLAYDVHLGRAAAIKALPSAGSSDPARLARLRREAQAAAAVSHPGIALVYAFLDTPRGTFIASEFIQGRSLRAEIARGPIDAPRAVRIAMEIADALAAAHDARVIHRDLKPENVLLTASGTVKVIDFGIARIDGVEGPGLTMPGGALGTPGYMAPEQMFGGALVDARADIYALGVILAEMVIGQHPLQRGSAGLREPLRAIVRRCMDPDLAARYESARDLRHDLEHAARVLSGAGGGAAEPAGGRALFWWRFHQGAATAVYWSMMGPLWFARGVAGGGAGRMLYFLALAAAVLATVLRLHLLFTSWLDAAQLAGQLRRERTWIVAADTLFAIALVVGGLVVGEGRMPLAVLLLSVGIGSYVASVFVEPATARAAIRPLP